MRISDTVLESLAKFPRQRSNWRFHSVSFESGHSHSEVCATGGSSYIPLSKFLAAKKAIINLKNEDDECFKCVITRALNPVEKTLNVLIKNFEKIRGPQLG